MDKGKPENLTPKEVKRLAKEAGVRANENILRNLELTMRRDRDGLSFGDLASFYGVKRPRTWELYHRTKRRYLDLLRKVYPDVYQT